MDPLGALCAVKRRWATVVFALGLSLVVAAFLNERARPVYAATGSVFIAPPRTNSLAEAAQGLALTQQLLESFATIATSRTALEHISKAPGVGTQPLGGRVTVRPKVATLLLQVRTLGSTPAEAQALGAATTKNLVSTITSLRDASSNSVQALVIDPPAAGAAPISPRRLRTLTSGGILGLALGIALALVRDSVDKRFRNLAQAEAVLTTPLVGTIGVLKGLEKHPFPVFSQQQSAAAEAFRVLRTAVRFLRPDDPIRSLIVTSSSASEGKTTTAINLALAIALGGEQVILVDADLRRGQVSAQLGLPSGRGLSDIVTGQAVLDDVLHGSLAGLQVLSAGTRAPNPSELLGSQRMADLLAELTSRAAIVIVDAPPVLAVTDAVVLSAQIDGVLLVVADGTTTTTAAIEAERQLVAVGANLSGFVFNRMKAKESQTYHYERSDLVTEPAGGVAT